MPVHLAPAGTWIAQRTHGPQYPPPARPGPRHRLGPLRWPQRQQLPGRSHRLPPSRRFLLGSTSQTAARSTTYGVVSTSRTQQFRSASLRHAAGVTGRVLSASHLGADRHLCPSGGPHDWYPPVTPDRSWGILARPCSSARGLAPRAVPGALSGLKRWQSWPPWHRGGTKPERPGRPGR